MIKRNIKQSLTALEVFNKLENKIYNKEIEIFDIYHYLELCHISIKKPKSIGIYLVYDQSLQISLSGLEYDQPLTDDEYTDVKKRFIKLCQFHQDEFEKWVIDTTDNNEIDAE